MTNPHRVFLTRLAGAAPFVLAVPGLRIAGVLVLGIAAGLDICAARLGV